MKYDGILICTDIDGTFESTEENIKKIKEFQALGGRFTVATGRNISYVRRLFSQSEVKLNAPAVLCNGGVIYDYERDKIVQENLLVPECLELFTKIAKDHNIDMRISQRGDTTETENIFVPSELIDKNRMYKAVWCSEDKMLPFAEFLKKNYSDDFEISQSASFLIEATKKGISKSSGTLFVKKYTDCHTLICVGDYGNDIPMLKTADISYAVENAIEETKKTAMRITVKNTESAIAKIIEDIQRSLK